MVNVWGYDGGPPSQCMFSTQNIRHAAEKRQVLMKLPKEYEIQRMVLARHLMYLRHPEIRIGKMVSTKEFENNVEDFKKLHIELRAPGPRGGILRMIRRKRSDKHITESSHNEYQQGIWNMQALIFKSVIPQMIRAERVKSYRKEQGRKRPLREMEAQEWNDKKDEQQRITWLNRIVCDMKSERVNGILGNYRKVTLNAVSSQPLSTIYLESSIYALKTHNWAAISKCLYGMVEHCRKYPLMKKDDKCPSLLNIFWMLGFLTVSNYYKDDVQKVEQFAKDTHALLGGFPLWIASHLAVWFIQKGFFMAAYRVVDEYSLEHLPRQSQFRDPFKKKSGNPKREITLFLTELIKAVYLYCVWKKECTLQPPDEDVMDLFSDIRIDDLRRKGEAALVAFETCHEKYKAIEGDAMCFLQPFMELVIEFRSVRRAREILEDVFNINDGNMFVEDFYVEFLEEHFTHLEEERDLIIYLKRRTQRKFTLKKLGAAERFKGRRQIKQMIEQNKKNGKMVSTMNLISNPTFSW